MKLKWPVSALSVLVLFALFSCGRRETAAPRYLFEIGKTQSYKLSGQVTIAADAGFLKYNGTVDISAEVEITAVDRDTNGYQLILDIKNPEFNGAGPQLTPLFYMGINYARTYLATMTLTEQGVPTVMFGTNAVLGLKSYAQIVFPDFSDPDALWVGATEKTNFGARLQDMELAMVFIRSRKIQKFEGLDVTLSSKYQFLTYDREDYLKAVEPEPNATLTLDVTDLFSIPGGRLERKTALLDLRLKLNFRQDFLSYIVTVLANGQFTLTRVETPS